VVSRSFPRADFLEGNVDNGPIEKIRKRRSRTFVKVFALHRLSALRAVHPHVLRVRSERQAPAALPEERHVLGVPGLGG